MPVFYHVLDETSMDFSEYIVKHSGDENIPYKTVEGNSLNMSLYYPADYDRNNKYPVFLFVHGGGWTSHAVFPDQSEWSGDYLGFLARYYAERGYVSVSIDYRLMQDNGQKEEYGLINLYQDCIDAICYLKKNENKYGLDFSNAVLLGESAGGYLAGAIATLSYLACPVEFRQLILVNAITDLFDAKWGARVPEESSHSFLRDLSVAERMHMLSPVWQISEKIPKTLLLHGLKDCTVHPEHSQKFYDEMNRYGGDVALHWIAETEHAFLLAEYMIEKEQSLVATSIAVKVIDQWLLKGE